MIVCGEMENVVVLERKSDGDVWNCKVLKCHEYAAKIIGIHQSKQQVVAWSNIDLTVRVWDMGARQWLPANVDHDTDYVFSVAISGKRVAYVDSRNGTVFVLDLVDGSWRKSMVQVDGGVEKVQMDEAHGCCM